MPNMDITIRCIDALLSNLNTHKEAGPEGIGTGVL